MTRFTFTGRLVQGDVYQAFPRKDAKTKQPKMRLDPTTNQMVPVTQCFAALAIPKDPAQRVVIPGNPTYEDQRALVDAAARASWPQFFTGQRPQGLQFPASLALDCSNPKFANKIIDGDGYDDQGQPYSANEGWAGCWVIKFSNGFVPKVYEWTASGWQETVHTGRKVKCGDYVSISGTCVSNQSTDSPGMYMNFDTVSFEHEGPFIASNNAPDPNAALGQRGAPASPPAQPPAPAGAPQNPAPANAGYAGAPAHTTAPAGTAPAYSGYRDPAAGAAPPPPAAPAAPAAPPAGPVMLPAANGIPYESYRAQGWTDDQLRANGMMA